MAGVAAVAAPPGDTGGSGELYSDLVIALRDVNGVPEMVQFDVPDDTGVVVPTYCVQPVSRTALPGVTSTVNPVDERDVWRIPLMGDLPVVEPVEGVEPEEVEVCDVQPAYASYVSEVELERLNMTRTSDTVLDQKLNDVELSFLAANDVTLDAAGRFVLDGLLKDAGPEYAAIYQALLTTGTVPALGGTRQQALPLDPFGLAAVAMGSAASKFTPMTIDAVAYYNRMVDPIPAANAVTTDGWTLGAWESQTREQFVDLSSFTYDRAATFPGAATWLDVPNLKWEVGKIIELAKMPALPPIAKDDGTLDNIAGFAQLVEDVRSVIFFLHENSVIPGFYADPVFTDTYGAQMSTLTEPAVDLGGVPAQLIQTRSSQVIASAYNPWGGTAIPLTTLRVTVDAGDDDDPATADELGTDFVAPDEVSFVEAGGLPVDFAVQDGDLVGLLDADGFEFPKGYHDSTPFDLVVGPSAPTGRYDLTLELVELTLVDGILTPGQILATHEVITTVLDDQLTLMWDSVPPLVTQGTWAPITATVFNPVTGDSPTAPATARITIDALDPLSAGQATAFSEAVPMPFTVVDGNLVGDWYYGPLTAGYDQPTTWALTITEGAPLGAYALTFELLDAENATLAEPVTAQTSVLEAATHGEQPPSPGPSTTPTNKPTSEPTTHPTEEPTGEPTTEPTEEPTTEPTTEDPTTEEPTTEPTTEPTASPSNTAAPEGPDGSGYVALASPVRMMDSRNGTGTPMEKKVGQVPLDLSSVIPEGASAAVLNITTTGVTQPGYVVVYADEPTGRGTSNQNLVPGEIRANEVVAALPASRRLVVNVHSSEPVDLIADLVGYFSPDTGGQVEVRTPTRVFDSRLTSTPLRSGETVLDLSDHVPDGASSVVLNVTTTGAAGPGYVVAYPTGTSKPRTSNVNFERGMTVANEAFVRLGTGPGADHVTFMVNGAPSVVVVDLWAVVVGEDADGLVLSTITPTRTLDTRYGIGTSIGRRVGLVSVPLPESIPATAKAVVMTVTLTGTEGHGHVRAFPGGDVPLASALNFSPGATTSNQVVVGVGPDRTVQLLIAGSDSPQSHVIADVLAVLE